MLRFLDHISSKLPASAILTDDPMRVKMLVAHHLDNASLISESRGMVAYSGTYSNVPVAVFSVGYGQASLLAYLREIAVSGAGRIIFLGECTANTSALRLGDVVFAESCNGAKGLVSSDGDILRKATSAAASLAIRAYSLPVFTNDLYEVDNIGIQDTQQKEVVFDFATNALYWYSRQNRLSALSILTVSEHAILNQRMESAEIQSRFHNASRLAFETLTKEN